MNTSVLTSVESEAGPVLVPLTIQQYHAMIASGILKEGDPIELIDGLLVRKDRRDSGGNLMTVGPNHTTTVGLLADALDAALSAVDVHSRQQQPLSLTGVSEPEPDIAVVAGMRGKYRGYHPGPADVHLVVEVADSSLAFDRSTKVELYASSAIPEYWIVNLKDKVMEIYRRPQSSDRCYLTQTTRPFKSSLSFILGDQNFEIDLTQVF